MKVRELDRTSLLQIQSRLMKGKPFREKNKLYDAKVQELTEGLGENRFNALQWFFTNATKAMRNGANGFSVRLKNDYWTANVCGISWRQVRFVIDYMQEKGYISIFKGSKDYQEEWKSFHTIIWFDSSLVALFDTEKLNLYIERGCLVKNVVVKDRKSKEEIDVEYSEKLERMIQEMNSYNESLSEASIEFMGKPVALVEYKRSFTQDLFHGGRLFVHGGGIQLLPQEYRLEFLTFSGEPVVELDYSSNHPNIIYEWLTQERPEIFEILGKEFKPYAADLSFVELDNLAIARQKTRTGNSGYDPVRNIAKLALLLCINCKGIGKTISTLQNEIFKDSKKKDDSERLFIGLVNPNCKKIVEAIAEHNHIISAYFYDDQGIKLQNVDSEIALRVIDFMVQNGETVLCYHDSFICRKGAKDLLNASMKEAWKEILGSDKFCKISEKTK